MRPSSVAANARTVQRTTAFAWVLGAISACGGGVAGQPTDTGSAFDAGVRAEAGGPLEASATPDAMEVDAAEEEEARGEDSAALPQCPAPRPATCAAIAACLGSIGGGLDSGDQGWVFDDQQTMVDFFRVIAVANELCTSVASCTYDPFAESNALGQLVGPDGLAYVWTYIPSRAEFLLAREDRDPVSYEIIVDANECTGDGRIQDGGTD